MTWWEVLVQQTINGLTRGAVFALIALGYTMVYGIIELINFAHGDVFMLGLFISLAWFTLLGVTTALTGWQLVTLLPLVFVADHADHGRAQRHHRPRRLPAAAPVAAAGPAHHRHRRVVHAGEHRAALEGAGAHRLSRRLSRRSTSCASGSAIDSAIFITTKDVLVVAVTLPLMVGAARVRHPHAWGKAMRATAQDRETAQAMGINVERTILITFFVGGALAGAAGLIQGMYYNIGQWWMGYQAGLRAFTAAVLGGIGNMGGAALGGLLIGFLSAWSDQYVSARWTNAIVFSILILVLVFRPHGLMGEASTDKA